MDYADYVEAKGIRKGIQKGIMEGTLTSLKNLIKNAGMTQEQAMELLEIPKKKREIYASRLNTTKTP